MSAADRRLDELRARREARAQDRAAFEENRQYGIAKRHAAKLAYLVARKEKSLGSDNSTMSSQQSVAPQTEVTPLPPEEASPEVA